MSIHLKAIIFSILTSAFMACTDIENEEKSLSSNTSSTILNSSASTDSTAPKFDKRVLLFQKAPLNTFKGFDPWILKLDSTQAKTMFSQYFDQIHSANCTYYALGTNHMESLSYYVISLDTATKTILFNNIHPRKELQCAYPQSAEANLFLVCEQNGQPLDSYTLKQTTIYNPLSTCTPHPDFQTAASLIKH